MSIIKLELTIEDAEKFKRFQRYYDDFSTMVNAGVFDFKSGKALINRDRFGILQEIKIEFIKYRKQKDLTKKTRGI